MSGRFWRAGTVAAGRPQMGTEIKIADENDEELPRGQVGQILVRGPQTMMGYRRLPEATDSALKGGWMLPAMLATWMKRGSFTFRIGFTT